MPHALWPVDPSVILPFLLAVSLIELTPGPNMGWLALVAAGRGRTAGLAAVVGITLGLAVWMLASAFGLTRVLLVWPLAFQVMRWAGVAFLLWLAWDAWRGGEAGTDQTDDGGTRQALFLRGLTGNLLNPKAAVFYVALLPTFIRPDHGPALTQALVLGTLHLAVAVIVHASIVIEAAQVAGMAGGQARGGWTRVAMPLGIAVVAVWMAWETRG